MSIFKKFKFFILLFCLLFTNIYAKVNWAKEVVESTMSRYSPASKLGSWDYKRGFYLYAQYRVWQKLGDDRYFQYIKDWLDDNIDSNGKIDGSINTLDNIQPGLITLYCYEETGEEKYKLAAESIRKVFDTYPRTSDGAIWHMKRRVGELWLDGAYMSLPFLMKYGQLFGDSTYCYNEASNQIILYASHLKDTTGLLYHGYDEDGSESWADPVMHRSHEFWGRSMGWFGMAIVEILEILPENHPNRATLIEILSNLIAGLSNYQDEATGLWYQVTNKGDQPDNWLETSCTCMYSFFTARAVERGYVDSSFIELALKGYQGILTKISIGNDGLTYFEGTCEGTEVGDYDYYIHRPITTNNMRGLPAFVLLTLEMSEYWKSSVENIPPDVRIKSPDDYSFFVIGSDIPILANAYDIDGFITQIEFYEEDNLLFTDTQEPWEYIWQDAGEGDYTLTAVAYDDSNANEISSPINITVTNDSLIYQAENAVIFEGTVDTDHQGYTGAGFVDYDKKVGSYIEWTLSFPTSERWNISFRYANGSVNNRPCRIELNGAVVDSKYDFESTGIWVNWIYSEFLEVFFNSGDNILRVTAITSEGGPNVDLLRLSNIDNSSIAEELFRKFDIKLFPNYPNPFNSSTNITYSLFRKDRVKLVINDISGRIVSILEDGIHKTAGTYTCKWDAVDSRDQKLPSGLYLCRLQAGSYVKSIKMILVQ